MDRDSPYAASATAPRGRPASAWHLAPPAITAPIQQMAAVGATIALFGFFRAIYRTHNALDLPAGSSAASLGLWLGIATFGLNLVLQLGLSWGVLRCSRVAACVLLAHYIGGKIFLIALDIGPGPPGLMVMAGVIFFMARGTMATFRFHRHAAELRRRPPARLSDDPAFAPKVDPSTLL